MNYYISDTHFGHENIMKHCNRPFLSIEDMDESILCNINERVTSEDDLYIVGDFCHWNPKEINPVDYLSRIRGKKHLITGNHDKSLIHNKAARAYFEDIRQYADIEDNGRRVILFHFPLAEWDGYHRGSYHIYGHVHNNMQNPAFSFMKRLDRAFNVSVDVIGFGPKTLDELIQMN